jgi:RNA polymerase-binding transcription factor DksA
VGESIVIDRIDNALARLGGWMYGRCLDCDRHIADRRLRLRQPSVPMRCQGCEQRLARQGDFRYSTLSRFSTSLNLGVKNPS